MLHTRHRVRQQCSSRLPWRLAGCAAPVIQPGDERAVVGAHLPTWARARTSCARTRSCCRSPAAACARAFAHGVLTASRERQDADGDLLRRRRIDQQRPELPYCGLLRRVWREGLARSQRGAAARFESGMRLSCTTRRPGANARWRPQRPRNFGDTSIARFFTARTLLRTSSPPGTRHTHSGNGPLSPGAFPSSAPSSRFSARPVSLIAWPTRLRRRWRCRCCSRPSSSGRFPELRAAPRGKSPRFAPDRNSRVLNSIARPRSLPRPGAHGYIKLADGGLTDNFGFPLCDLPPGVRHPLRADDGARLPCESGRLS